MVLEHQESKHIGLMPKWAFDTKLVLWLVLHDPLFSRAPKKHQKMTKAWCPDGSFKPLKLVL